MILPVFFINRAGIPIKDFGFFLCLILTLIAAVILKIKLSEFPRKRFFQFYGLLFVALAISGRPMLRYGFDWLSFANGDMANYCLGAKRFLNHGYFDALNLEDLYRGKDYSLDFWFMHVDAGFRSGSELMLAVISAASGFNSHKIFMPTIMALNLALIAAACALVADTDRKPLTPFVALLLLALSPLNTLGALYQLIGQVGGLALLSVAIILMYRIESTQNKINGYVESIPAIFVFAAIFVWYPEILPFFGLGWIVNFVLIALYNKKQAIVLLGNCSIIGLAAAIILNQYLYDSILSMFRQAQYGVQSADLSSVLFPYFLVPSGIAQFWGITPIASIFPEPIMSLSIVGGFFLFGYLVLIVLPRQILKRTLPVSVLIVMLVMAITLFVRNSDFGLYKLAMYAQPFMLCTIAIELVESRNSVTQSRFSWGGAIVLGFLMISTQSRYIAYSTGEVLGGFNEIPHVSSLKVVRQFDDIIHQNPELKDPDSILILNTANSVIAKLQAFYTDSIQTFFVARHYFDIKRSRATPEGLKLVEKANQYYGVQLGDNQFEAILPNLTDGKKVYYISSNAKSDIFNSYYLKTENKEYFSIVEKPINSIYFIHSKLGQHYVLADDRRNISFYQLENDPMFEGQLFSALGRRLVLGATNPTKNSRIVMELSDTVLKQVGCKLPNPTMGNSKVSFVGRGSARVVSDPIVFTSTIAGPILSIDMGRDGEQFPNRYSGLMNLYGRYVTQDQRRITTFARDISLISDDQYQSLTPPVELKSFPADLANKNLEYSGIYEDGWISETSYFVLTEESSSKFVEVSGFVPNIGDLQFNTVLKLSIGGMEIASEKLGVGVFELKVPIKESKGKQRIDIAFSKYQQLPGDDARIIGGKLNFIGFK